MKPKKAVRWEPSGPSMWTSDIGYVEEKNEIWTAYVYRNVSTGKSWTESRPGFGTHQSARAWVERNYSEE